MCRTLCKPSERSAPSGCPSPSLHPSHLHVVTKRTKCPSPGHRLKEELRRHPRPPPRDGSLASVRERKAPARRTGKAQQVRCFLDYYCLVLGLLLPFTCIILVLCLDLYGISFGLIWYCSWINLVLFLD